MTAKPRRHTRRYVKTPRFTKSEWLEITETLKGVISGHSLVDHRLPLKDQIDGMDVGGYLEPNRAMIRVLRKLFC